MQITSSRNRVYQLEQRPRRGGQAEVYRARGPEGRVVAVKIALSGGLESTLLEREGALLRRIHERDRTASEWLVRVDDDGLSPEKRRFLVLPWYEHTLATCCKGTSSLHERLDVLILACKAVARFHFSTRDPDHTHVHRDIKPQNFLVASSGGGPSVVLADLGIAKEGAPDRTGTHTRRPAFTQYFAPLDQQLGLRGPPDPSVDIHALAVTIWTCLTERYPQTILSRTGLLNEQGRRLYFLIGKDHGDEDEEREIERLQRLPLTALADLDEGARLLPEDVTLLGNQIAALLEDQGIEAGALAGRIRDVLIPALNLALEADPGRRHPVARRLQEALQEARQALPSAPRVMLAPPPTSAALPPPIAEIALPPSRAGGRRTAALLVVGSTLFAALVLVSVTLIVLNRSPVGAAQAEVDDARTPVDPTRTPEPAEAPEQAPPKAQAHPAEAASHVVVPAPQRPPSTQPPAPETTAKPDLQAAAPPVMASTADAASVWVRVRSRSDLDAKITVDHGPPQRSSAALALEVGRPHQIELMSEHYRSCSGELLLNGSEQGWRATILGELGGSSSAEGAGQVQLTCTSQGAWEIQAVPTSR